ncbi:MAG: hypothetical protein D6729_08095 [Deltaproteobacteria bacterium]|nr:MAG: hypothetical protein D6729_08095 [Deltaproteobacteria bacterium]
MAAAAAGLGLAAAILATGCDPLRTTFAETEPGRLLEAQDPLEPPATLPPELVVMTYNIKYGGARILFFWECGGTRYNMTEEEVLGNMAGLAAKIREVDPDILLLQEVDVGATRAAYVDEAQYLLDHTALSYGAYASQWKADYIPSDGLGRMDSGNVVLSKWPVREATRHALPLIGNQDPLTQYFYLRRNVLEVRLDVPGIPDLRIFAVHAAAFATDGTKKKHIDRFKALMDAAVAEGALVVGGGDLNSIPPGSPKRENFNEDCEDARFKGDSYVGEEDWLDGLYADYQPAIPLDAFQANPVDYYTYSGREDIFWNRKIDYLFTNGRFTSGVVHQDERTGLPTLPLSDHAPLVATLEVP